MLYSNLQNIPSPVFCYVRLTQQTAIYFMFKLDYTVELFSYVIFIYFKISQNPIIDIYNLKQKMTKKVYISDIDSPLGYHLVEFFRDDHLDLQNHTLIVGTASGTTQINGVYQTISFANQPQLACRSSLDCDVIILNLRTPTDQAEIIIKFFESVNKSLKKMVRIIGISTTLTWEGMQTYQTQKDVGDREKFIATALDENSWKKLEYNDSQYQNRISSNLYGKSYELENMILNLNKFKNIKASVLCAGVIYGKDSSELQSEILTSLGGGQLILCGAGSNLIPLVHIETLIQSLGILIETKDYPYSIIVDEEQFTQLQIKDTINETTGNSKSLLHRESSFLTKEDSLWSSSLSLISSSIFKSQTNKNNFKSYAGQLISDFCEYTLYCPKQTVVFTDDFQESVLVELTNELKGKIPIITQGDIDKLDNQLIQEMAPPQPQMVKKQNKSVKNNPQEQQPQHYYKQVLSNLLQSKKTSNYVLICNKKMNQFIDSAYFFGGMIEIIPTNVEKTEGQKQIQYKSKAFMQFFEIDIAEKKQQVEEINIQNIQKIEKDIYVGAEKTMKKDENLIMINQYLLDNVLGHISQAKFNMKLSKKQTNLKNLIVQLKLIYNRYNCKNSSTKSKLESR